MIQHQGRSSALFVCGVLVADQGRAVVFLGGILGSQNDLSPVDLQSAGTVLHDLVVVHARLVVGIHHDQGQHIGLRAFFYLNDVGVGTHSYQTMTVYQRIFTHGLGVGAVVGLAVVFPITRSRLYDNGSGKHGQNAVVQIVDIIVGRLVDLIAPDLEAQGVGATTVGYVRDCSLLDDLYPVTGNEGIFLHKVIAAVALGLAVVDERVAIRTECEGLGMDDQLAVFIGDLIVFRDVLVVGVQNHDL